MLLFSFLPRRPWAVFCIGLGAGVTLYLLADFFVYQQFRLHIDMAMLSMFFGSAGGDIFVFPTIMYVQAALGSLAALALVAGCWVAAGRLAQKWRSVKAFYILLFASILFFHGGYAWASFNMYAPITAQASILPLVQPLSLNSLLKDCGFKPATDLPRFNAKTLKYPLAQIRYVKPEKQLNLVVIMLDGWRFDGMTAEVSPNIYEFARLTQRFNKHNAAANHTRHGVFSFFYGLPGVYWDSALVGKVPPVLMDAVLEAGYSTGVFGSSSLTSPEFDRTVFAKVQGVDLFTAGKTPQARDLEITNKFLRFMDERDQAAPFFSFLFYDSTHAYAYDQDLAPPIFVPDTSKNYLNSTNDQNLRLIYNRYKNSIRYNDVLVKRVLDRLRRDNLLENTVVIITSDHGEEFDDNKLGYIGHNGNFSHWQTHVPMLVYWPGREAADYNYPTSHLDVAPTLMEEIFGCATPVADYSNGLNLFTPGPRQYAFMMGPSTSYGIQVGDYITVFPPIGPSQTVDAQNYHPADWKMPPEVYRRFLRDLARFKK